jgi:hypothetical protein
MGLRFMPQRLRHRESAVMSGPRVLDGIPEIRHFFRTNETPVYFVGATPFNLLGLDRWVRILNYVTYYDGWDGAHPRVISPLDKPYVEFDSGEEINNYLLRHPEIRAIMGKEGPRPKVAMVFFDEETEEICADYGYDLILPSAELRKRLDSKIVTTRLGNEAGAPSVPNVLTELSSYEELISVATAGGLGRDLVVQTPYGDSGKTTFFVASRSDWERDREEIVGEPIKVMRRINHRAIAVEAVITRHGTVVGPFMSELTGHKELTPYKDVEFELDVEEVNSRWDRLASADLWSQMIIKETRPVVEHIDAAPATGQCYLDADQNLVFRRAALDWHQLQNTTEAFFLRITERAVRLIDAIRSRYSGTPIPTDETPSGVGAKSGA